MKLPTAFLLILLATPTFAAVTGQAVAPARPAAKAVAAPAGPGTRWSADCTPNYLSSMVASCPEWDPLPRLLREWSHWPLQVAIVDDGKWATAERIESVKASFQKWSRATLNVPEGAVSFRIQVVKKATKADVVVGFTRAEDIGGYKGYAERQDGGWMRVRVAAEAAGKAVASADLVRCLTHEIGHVLGIWAHSLNKGDVMSLDTGPCEISVADVNALRIAYRPR